MLNDLMFLAAPIEAWVTKVPPAAQTLLDSWPLLMLGAFIIALICWAAFKAGKGEPEIHPVQYQMDPPRENIEIQARRAGE